MFKQSCSNKRNTIFLKMVCNLALFGWPYL